MFPMIDKVETGVNLRRIMDLKGISVRDVQDYLELGCVQSVYHWISGQSMPSIDNLYALSELFQMPIDEIVMGNRKVVYAPEICRSCDRSADVLYVTSMGQSKAA